MNIIVGNLDRLWLSFASNENDEFWGRLRFEIGGQLVSSPEEQVLVTRFGEGLRRSLHDCGRRILTELERSWDSIWYDLLISCWGCDDDHPIGDAERFSVLNFTEECFDANRIFLVEQPEIGVETYLVGPTSRSSGETLEEYIGKVRAHTFPYGCYKEFVENFSREFDALSA